MHDEGAFRRLDQLRLPLLEDPRCPRILGLTEENRQQIGRSFSIASLTLPEASWRLFLHNVV